MSDSDAGFGKYVPGFDFLQGLAKNAAAGAANTLPQMPNLSNWITPSLNVEELDKRLEELKAVHFWLDQNSKALGATIQALEVQKMTLATLKGMNFNLGDVANAFKLRAADSVAAGVQKVTETAASAAKSMTPGDTAKGDAAKGATGLGGLVDPLQLWTSLTQQFGQIAAGVMKEAGRNAAAAATKPAVDGQAKEAVKATGKTAPVPVSKKSGKTAAKKSATRR
jgi:hypothetical protein